MLKNYIFTLIVLFFSYTSIFAHSEGQHINDMYEILFGDLSFSRSNPSFQLLRQATTLTLDQYKEGQNIDKYNFLKENGVPYIPELDKLTYSASPSTHQRYTHLGWNFVYIDKRGNWEQRKLMLVSTVNHVFKFKETEKIKADSFAALLYEIHILGDHIGDKQSTSNTRIKLCSEKGYKGELVSPTSDGPFNNATLITYMIYHSERLFRGQKSTKEYKALINFLHSKKDAFLQTEITANNYDATVRRLAKEIKAEMIKYIPTLLRREAFFTRVFY